MNTRLKRPIVFFDLETTGISITHDRIVEIAMKKINPDGTREEYKTYVNPTIPIPQGAQDVHHISNDDVSDAPTFSTIAKEVNAWIAGCDLGGYNIIRFDIPILLEEFLRAGILWNYKEHKIIDVFKIYSVIEPRTLAGTYHRFTGKTLENAHSAQVDNDATIEIFEAQLEKYGDKIPEDLDNIADVKYPNEKPNLDLAGKFIVEDKTVLFNFGKYKGKSVKDIFNEDANYFMWMVDKGDFSNETKTYARKIHAKLSTVTLHQ